MAELKPDLPEWMEKIESEKPAKRSYVRQPVQENPEFYGQREPQWEVETERPIHRAACFMLARGQTQKQVAEHLQVTAAAVATWLRQPWFQEQLATIMSEDHQDVMSILKAEEVNTALKLIELRDNPTAPASVRLGAIKEIFDRTCGKAVVHMEVKELKGSEDPVAEVARLEEEAKRLSGRN